MSLIVSWEKKFSLFPFSALPLPPHDVQDDRVGFPPQPQLVLYISNIKSDISCVAGNLSSWTETCELGPFQTLLGEVGMLNIQQELFFQLFYMFELYKL